MNNAELSDEQILQQAEQEALLEANDLAAMAETPGWARLEKCLQRQVVHCQEGLLAASDMNQVYWFQALAQACRMLQGEVKTAIDERRRLSEVIENEKASNGPK